MSAHLTAEASISVFVPCAACDGDGTVAPGQERRHCGSCFRRYSAAEVMPGDQAPLPCGHPSFYLKAERECPACKGEGGSDWDLTLDGLRDWLAGVPVPLEEGEPT